MLDFILNEVRKTAESQPCWYLAGQDLQDSVAALCVGVRQGDEESLHTFHRMLAILNRERLSIGMMPSPCAEQFYNGLCTVLETEWLALEREQIKSRFAEVPTDPQAFVGWFEALQQTGYGQDHPLFLYLSERADLQELRYFFHQEMGTEAGFDDLVALVQVKTAPPIRTELARNYWDEMGSGRAEYMHSHLLMNVAKSFELTWQEDYQSIHWTPLALSNLMVALATKRTLFAQAIGALGVIELTSPGRCIKVVEGMKRIGMTGAQYHYYALHASLDKKHWEGWKDNVVWPLIEERPAYMRLLAEGALLRLFAGNRCFETYSRHLGLSGMKIQGTAPVVDDVLQV